jgi:gas vesicle protein
MGQVPDVAKEAFMARKVSSNMAMLVGGSVVGAGLALLFAPWSGAKSRKKMTKFGRTMSKRSEYAMRSLSDGMSDFADSMNSMGRRATSMFGSPMRRKATSMFRR